MPKMERKGFDSPQQEHEPNECIFCGIVKGTNESAVIGENESSLAFVSLEGYPLIVPKMHLTDNIEDREIFVSAFEFALSFIEPAKKALNSEGITILSNIGRAAGQEIEHLHIHLVDRNFSDRKIRYSFKSPLDLMQRSEKAEIIREEYNKLNGG